jgi:hypothetical protein
VQAFWTKAALIDSVHRTSAYADQAVVFDSEIDGAAGRAKHAGRLDPSVWLLNNPFVYPHRPLASMRRALAPKISDAVA